MPYEERRRDDAEFGTPQDIPTSVCHQIQQATGAHIEISHAKDESLTFLVTGKYSDVLEARRRIQNAFQMQVSKVFDTFDRNWIYFGKVECENVVLGRFLFFFGVKFSPSI